MNQDQNNLSSDNQSIQNNESFNQGIDDKQKSANIFDDKRVYKRLKTSLILFCIILLISLSEVVSLIIDHSSWGTLIIILLMILLAPLFFISLGFFFSASYAIKKQKKSGIKIPENVKKTLNTNKIMIPLIVLVLVGGFLSKNIGKNVFINIALNKHLHSTNYKVLKKCSNFNEGGDDYLEVIVGLDNYEYPIYTKFDWNDDSYKDNYDILKRADSYNYQSYVKSMFDNKALSMLILDEGSDDDEDYSESVKWFELKILLTKDYLEDEDVLKNKVKEIYNKYSLEFSDYLISISLYFTDNIKSELKQDYYVVISEYGCHYGYTYDGYIMKDKSYLTIPMRFIFNNLEYYSVDETINNGIGSWYSNLEELEELRGTDIITEY